MNTATPHMTKVLTIFRITGKKVGMDEKARLSACRRAFSSMGGEWEFLQVEGDDTIIVGSSSTRVDVSKNTARGVRVENMGTREVPYFLGEKSSIFIGGRHIPTTTLIPRL